MFSPFICGSFHHQEDDDIGSLSPCSTPKRSRRSASYYRSKESSKNPYAHRGLDKFNALLSEVDEKKQRIYTQKGAGDISIVRFVVSNDDEIKPLVVKQAKDKVVRHGSESNAKPFAATPNNPHKLEASSETKDKKESLISLELVEQRQKKKKSCCYFFKLEKLKQPCYYLPIILILILMFLAIYGRSFAILCTSIGWYMIPTIRGSGTWSSSSSDDKNTNLSRKPKRKQNKEYTRRMSEKTLGRTATNSNINYGSSSPTSVIDGPAVDVSPRKEHGHRRSF